MYFQAGQRYQDAYNALLREYECFDFIKKENLNVRLLECDERKTRNGRRTYADCSRLSEKMRAISEYDFVITFYACDDVSDSALKILTFHEMKHIGCQDGKLKIIPHDVEDFKEIIDTYGTDWVKS